MTPPSRETTAEESISGLVPSREEFHVCVSKEYTHPSLPCSPEAFRIVQGQSSVSNCKRSMLRKYYAAPPIIQKSTFRLLSETRPFECQGRAFTSKPCWKLRVDFRESRPAGLIIAEDSIMGGIVATANILIPARNAAQSLGAMYPYRRLPENGYRAKTVLIRRKVPAL